MVSSLCPTQTPPSPSLSLSLSLSELHVPLPPCILQLHLPSYILPLSHTISLSPQILELGFALSPQSSIICMYTFPPAFSSYSFLLAFFLSLTPSYSLLRTWN